MRMPAASLPGVAPQNRQKASTTSAPSSGMAAEASKNRMLTGADTTKKIIQSMAKASSRTPNPAWSGKLHQLLAEILSLEERDQPLGRVVQPFDHRLAV